MIARPALVPLQMIVATPVGRLEIITNLVGRHNVYNVLAAVAVGVLLNLPLEDIGAGIESVQFVPGRWVGWGVCWCRNRLMALLSGSARQQSPTAMQQQEHKRLAHLDCRRVC